MEASRDRFLRALSLLGFVGIWQAVAATGLFPRYFLPAPTDVAQELINETISLRLVEYMYLTFVHYSTGLLIGISAGIFLGIIVGWYRVAENLLEPIIEVLRPIPGLAWIPFVIIWFGITQLAAAMIIAIITFFINFFSTYAGVKDVDRGLIEAALTLSERRGLWLLSKVVVPASSPHILAGVRISLGQGLMAVVASEMFGIQGLGFRMMEAAGLLAMDVVVAYMAVLGFLYLSIDRMFKRIELTLLRWR